MKKYLILIALLLLAGCTQTQPIVQGTDTEEDTGDNTGDNTGNSVTIPVKEFEITAKRWEFIPSTIEVNKGDRVRLKVTSIDVTHGMALPDFGVESVRLPPNETQTIEFVADKTGTFNPGMICTVFCGSGHSDMKGSIIVR
ncbi:cupredoxin domain-containing protein [Candidatus Woesearchaeota archaeon]|nr:cupredoxin domain-containing protein [Candidatus Woesearchaeota archaeon]